jgi:hypothetical protein
MPKQQPVYEIGDVCPLSFQVFSMAELSKVLQNRPDQVRQCFSFEVSRANWNGIHSARFIQLTYKDNLRILPWSLLGMSNPSDLTIVEGRNLKLCRSNRAKMLTSS